MSTLGTLSQWSSSLQKALPVAQRANSRETADRNLRILIDSSSSKKTVCFFGLDSLSLNQPMNLSICDGVSILERMKSSCSQLYALSRANLSVFEQKRLSVQQSQSGSCTFAGGAAVRVGLDWACYSNSLIFSRQQGVYFS
ncbi:Hypothetical_protein [Hexamita inflata]|uniref:Hypothetical_protein n=1 Tax=Hexamita inflata TaxID=28002 RepID=A0AA86NMF7_9EUKA|nr:Hypothetical protein HINF_LOCUS9894 [Hexamita inflata]